MTTYLLMGVGALALVIIVALIFFTAQSQAKRTGKAEAVADQKTDEADAARKVAQAAVEGRPDPSSDDLVERVRRSDW